MAHDKLGCLPVVEQGHLVGVVTTTDLLEAQVRTAMEPRDSGGPTVAEAMVRNPAIAHPADRLLDAALRMKSLNVRHLPVVDATGRALGMLSDRDVRAAIGDPNQLAGHADAIDRLRVKDAMTAPAITVEPGRSCADVARDFVHLRASAVPVTDEQGVVIGILSYIDLLRMLAQ
jgi:acetoin utilization protein AcuB